MDGRDFVTAFDSHSVNKLLGKWISADVDKRNVYEYGALSTAAGALEPSATALGTSGTAPGTTAIGRVVDNRFG